MEGELSREGEGLYDKMNGIGAHEVIVESPEHIVSMGDLPDKRVEDLFWAFRDRIVDLKKDKRLRYIILFKNHGEAAGASLEHSHSQLIALPVVPKRMQEEIDGARRYYDFKERCIYCDIVRQELTDTSRLILETEQLVVISPYAPRFPFETWILPRKHASHFEEAEYPHHPEPGIGGPDAHSKDGQSAGTAGLQPHGAYGAGAGRGDPALSLACGSDSEADARGGL